jgi:replicative DNA helicase
MIQCQVLNHILSSKDSSILVLNNFNGEYFSDYLNEFNFINKHISEYGNIPDMETFLDKFPDFDIIQVSENPKYLVEQLCEDRNKRFLANTFNKIRDHINKGNTDAAMAVFNTASQNITKGIHLDSFDIINDISRYDLYIEKSQDFSKYYVKTGFDELDELIGGWDRNEELATIVARPGVGKSWVLLLVAIAAAKQGLKVGLYSGEMSETKVGYRFDTLAGHISNSSIMHGNEKIQIEYKKFLDSLKDKFKGSIKVLTPAMINGPAGVTALRAFVEKENLDILCIDQHSLLEDDRKARTPVEKAANISRDLKNLQVMKKIPVIAVSQQNRSATDDGPSTANVAQSDRISQDSTVIIFLEQKDGILTLNLVKARDAVNGKKIHYACDFDKGIFNFIPEGDEELSKSNSNELLDEYEYKEGENVF